MERNYSSYMERARAMLAEGFATKQARKDALDDVSRAFDFVKKAIHDKLLTERDACTTEAAKLENHGLYWSVPDCYVWKAKHAALFVAKFPDEVAQANACAELRKAIVDAPQVAKKVDPKRAAREAADAAKCKTCQICGRSIFAEVGKIAHHGYQRPGDGWQTASCFGARELPYEASRDVLGQYVAGLRNSRDSWERTAEELEDETRHATLEWLTYGEERDRFARRREISHHETVTRATFACVVASNPSATKYWDAHRSHDLTFENVKAECVAAAKRNHEFFRSEHKRQLRRFNEWKLTHEWRNGEWERV